MTDLINFDEQPLRHQLIGSEPWFCGKDVCEALGYASYHDKLHRLPAEHKKVLGNTETLGGNQSMTYVNEAGIYHLTMTSYKPSAMKFKDWIATEVIPSLRKTGQYQMQDATDYTSMVPTSFKDALLLAANQQEVIEQQEKQLLEAQPKVAFYNHVANQDQLFTMEEAAKLMQGEGLNIGRNRLARYLRKARYLTFDNQPYQKWIESNHFSVKTSSWTSGVGNEHISYQPFLTGKGLARIHDELVAELTH